LDGAPAPSSSRRAFARNCSQARSGHCSLYRGDQSGREGQRFACRAEFPHGAQDLASSLCADHGCCRPEWRVGIPSRRRAREAPISRQRYMRRSDMRILVINPNTTASMTRKIGTAAQAVASTGTTIVAINPDAGPPSIEGYYDEVFAIPAMIAEI